MAGVVNYAHHSQRDNPYNKKTGYKRHLSRQCTRKNTILQNTTEILFEEAMICVTVLTTMKQHWGRTIFTLCRANATTFTIVLEARSN